MEDSNPQEQVSEHLSKALNTEERTEKQFHIREALQLLNLEDDDTQTSE